MTAEGPLNGVTVVDLSRVLAGPYCTMVLADLGARVIKVEHPEGGDDARHIGPFVDGQSAYFTSINRGKQSIALDLKTAAGRGVFEHLLARADVLVENFRGGALAKLGYGWDVLHGRHPRLIYAAASGFGHTGPDASRPAYDMVVQAMGGIMSVTGHPGAGPTRVGTSIGDIAAGLFCAVGVCAALHHRDVTGEAVKVDVAMLDAQIAILENAIARYFATGESPGPLGSRHPSITPFEAYATKNGHIIIAAGNDRLFAALCDVLGRPELAGDARFTSNDLRTQDHAVLKEEIERCLAGDTSDVWLGRLGAAGIPCGPINDVAAALAEPQVVARNMVIEAGGLRMAGNPIKMSAFDDPPTRRPAPQLDADRDAILKEIAE